MTYRDPTPEPPWCPVCGQRGQPNRDHPQLGRFVCSACTPMLFFDGTTAEFERYEDARNRRKATSDG